MSLNHFHFYIEVDYGAQQIAGFVADGTSFIYGYLDLAAYNFTKLQPLKIKCIKLF